ncbi:MAG: hypothetical protein AAFN78_06060, partial [Pseudomonadota bacterium]
APAHKTGAMNGITFSKMPQRRIFRARTTSQNLRCRHAPLDINETGPVTHVRMRLHGALHNFKNPFIYSFKRILQSAKRITAPWQRRC